MIALILFFGCAISFLISALSLRYLDIFFIFLLYSLVGFIVSLNSSLTDIEIYKAVFHDPDKLSWYFEILFLRFLSLFESYNFNLVYGFSIGIAACATYYLFKKVINESHNLCLPFFILLYSSQFILGWRQALMYPGFIYIVLFFLFYRHLNMATFGKAVPFFLCLFFHLSSIISLFVPLYLLIKKSKYLAIFIMIVVYLVSMSYINLDTFYENIYFKFADGESYLDSEISTNFRQILVVFKFIVLLTIAFLAADNLNKSISDYKLILFLASIKLLFSLFYFYLPHPVWGRINGLLTFVDFIILTTSFTRFPILTFLYLLFSFAASIVFNPYYNNFY